MGFPQSRLWAQQPQQNADLSALGLTPIGVFSGALKKRDAVNATFTESSATAYGASNAGMASLQTAVNTGLYRPVSVPSVATGYIVVWHGVLVGAPVGGTPKYTGISTSTTSQSVDIIGIEVGTSGVDHIAVNFRSGGVTSNRQFSVGMSAFYGKTVTMVASFDIVSAEARLTICADGAIYRYSSSVVSPVAPTMLGTEQFCVGSDVIERPTRHPNAKVALAGAFYGNTNRFLEESIAVNPWRIFKPRPPLWLDAVAGGGGASVETSATISATAFSGSVSVSPVVSSSASAALPAFSGSITSGDFSVAFDFSPPLPGFAGSISVSPSVSATTTVSLPAFSGSITIATGGATITITDLKDLTTGTLRASEAGVTAIINNVSTGALVALLTGQTSTAGGDMALSHAALAAATEYRVTIILADGSEGTWKYTAA